LPFCKEGNPIITTTWTNPENILNVMGNEPDAEE
jgi:hypothetical protein